jgi:DNA polymerase-4
MAKATRHLHSRLFPAARRARIARMAPDVSTILHADMDAFYAAVEQRDQPELRGKPVIVGGASPRGVVLTASYEARAFGVHSAMPGVHARRLCPQGIFVPPRMRCYLQVARQIRTVFEEFTPLVEPLSLDEAFLDVTGSLRLFGTAQVIGRRLKQRVREVTDLPVSVGIGPTKMIAKIASAMCKPDGLLEVAPDQVETFLRPLPVSHLWGVGPTTQAALARAGITTIGALADAEPSALEGRFGKLGALLWALAHGHDGRSVDADRQRKSYGEEETFDRDLRDGERVRRTIAAHAEAVASRLRADGCRGRTVTLKLKLAQRIGPGKYPVLTRRVTLPAPVDDGKSITDAALALWRAVQAGKTVRLIGVSVSGIEDEGGQLPLFGARDTQRRTALNEAVDKLAARFGRTVVSRGGVGDS